MLQLNTAISIPSSSKSGPSTTAKASPLMPLQLIGATAGAVNVYLKDTQTPAADKASLSPTTLSTMPASENHSSPLTGGGAADNSGPQLTAGTFTSVRKLIASTSLMLISNSLSMDSSSHDLTQLDHTSNSTLQPQRLPLLPKRTKPHLRRSTSMARPSRNRSPITPPSIPTRHPSAAIAAHLLHHIAQTDAQINEFKEIDGQTIATSISALKSVTTPITASSSMPMPELRRIKPSRSLTDAISDPTQRTHTSNRNQSQLPPRLC